MKRSKKAKPRKRWRRRLLWAGAVLLVGTLLLWVAVHRIPWLGPAIADGLRAVVGVRAVAALEDFVYDVEDAWNRTWRSGEEPKARWSVPEPTASAPPPVPAADASVEAGPPPLPAFRPEDVGPMFSSMAAKGDGVWVPVSVRIRASSPVMYKTLLHPDRERPWAEVFVVAIDRRRVRLDAVAGSRDPRSVGPEAKRYERLAKIPPDDHARVIAAFNGGFKAEHGRYGMMVDGVVLLPPIGWACTIAAFRDGSLRIATWKEIQDQQSGMRWWRQTPPCMYKDGKMHGALWEEETTAWGAAVEGDTVIRRSAMAVDASGSVLLVGLSNFTTARKIADAMKHAGGHDVAQLDVNWSFPRFVTYHPGDAGQLVARSLFEGFLADEGEYLREPSPRDFFYLTFDRTDQ